MSDEAKGDSPYHTNLAEQDSKTLDTPDLPLWYLILLSLVQGITEFLPISSSAHLILLPLVAHVPDQGIMIDVATHVGTLLAVLMAFRKDVGRLFAGGINLLQGKIRNENTDLLLKVAVGTIPVVIVGACFKDVISSDFRSPVLIAATSALFGLLLWWSDRKGGEATGDFTNLTWRVVILIGLFQAVALVPGVSRSGITMTAALFCGLQRTEAARFSLLLAIPTTAAAGLLVSMDLMAEGSATLQLDALIAAALSFVSAWGAIILMMRWLRNSGFGVFVVYRLLLSGALLFALWSGLL
ncbi:undecaprenyl-diphosphate phosphatase [Kiloniella sp. b19]|uniref:undecaprenyl-diphosphate phosphatase n=1 Tax=Kiloniella sp. GXU_MW_B19 TaxID=3141326 RepID=UPI0031DA8C69